MYSNAKRSKLSIDNVYSNSSNEEESDKEDASDFNIWMLLVSELMPIIY